MLLLIVFTMISYLFYSFRFIFSSSSSFLWTLPWSSEVPTFDNFLKIQDQQFYKNGELRVEFEKVLVKQERMKAVGSWRNLVRDLDHDFGLRNFRRWMVEEVGPRTITITCRGRGRGGRTPGARGWVRLLGRLSEAILVQVADVTV